jgi:hypothetical protein
MAIQIVMDRTGDSRHPFDPDDAKELAKAEQRFYRRPGERSRMRATRALFIRHGGGGECPISNLP